MTGETLRIFNEVREERRSQRVKWGEQEHIFGVWLAILMEELGEACKASLENRPADVRRELVQATAVLVAWIEHTSISNYPIDPLLVYVAEEEYNK